MKPGFSYGKFFLPGFGFFGTGVSWRTPVVDLLLMLAVRRGEAKVSLGPEDFSIRATAYIPV